jgi:hypothetical protein
MKAGYALIAALVVVIIIQITLLVRRITSSPPSQTVASEPAGGLDAPPPVLAPSARPSGTRPGQTPERPLPGSYPGEPAGKPGQPPKGPPVSGSPGRSVGSPNPYGPPPGPAPGGGPPPGAPSGPAAGGAPPPAAAPGLEPGQISLELIPYSEFLEALLSLKDSGHPFTAAQKERLRPLLAELAAIGTKSSPEQVLATTSAVLSGQQVEYIVAHRADRGNAPSDADGALLALLKTRGGQGGSDVSPAASPSGGVILGPEDLVAGLLSLEHEPSLALTPGQARALLPPLTGYMDVTRRLSEQRTAIVAVLDAEQRAWIVKKHDEFLKAHAQRSPTESLAELQRQVQ